MTEAITSPLVLLVEDDTVTQALVTALLGKLGISPVVAKDAEETRTAFYNQKYDLILMDINLPGASGIELCNEIRQKEKGTANRTLIVALTGMNGPDDRKICLDAGMDGYFTKPIDRMKLKGFVMNLLKLGK